MQHQFPTRIISGGQTGVDRAALDVAILLGIDHGGWCPRGRLAEDGEIPARYRLQETALPHYHIRTEWNVRDSDATLVLYATELSGGSALTVKMADKHRRPKMLVDLDANHDALEIRNWVQNQQASNLNIAGPRESTVHGIQERAQSALMRILGSVD